MTVMRCLGFSRRAFAASAVAVLCACTAVDASSKQPSWVLNPPTDTPEALYGAADGYNAEDARRNALRSISARLRSAISGTTKSSVSDTNGRVDRQDSIDTTENVIETEFSGAQVQATAEGGAGVFVLVKVDRQAFIKDTREQIGVLEKSIGPVEAAMATQSPLERFVGLTRVKTDIEKARGLSQLLAGAGARSDGDAGASRYGGLLQQAKDLPSTLTFELRAPPTDADVAKALAGFLSNSGMRSAMQPTPGANVLTIQTDGREAAIGTEKMVRLTVRLSVVDAAGRAVASREYAASGKSRFDFKGARDAAVANFASAIGKAGPVKGLGFKE